MKPAPLVLFALSAACLGIGALSAVTDSHPPEIHPPPLHPPIDPPPRHDPGPEESPIVEIALLLDTSNSMDGLIHQAKSQLWSIVQQFAHARRHGRAPTLRVALFEYGNTRLPATEGYIRQVVPLTDDLDRLSAALFALTTQGGDEYCGQVIDEAVTRLAWAGRRGGYRAVFIAGNEPFTQGDVHYRSAAERALAHGIVVNTIHCGPHHEGVAGMWEDGARAGRGRFFNIDQDRRVPVIRCPQDVRLMELNSSLNETYLWYGAREAREALASNQAAQDANAQAAGGQAPAQRAAVKASGAYRNVGRDLVDSYLEDPDILARLQPEELPEEMQRMGPEEQEAHIKDIAQKRTQIRDEIGRLSVERETYVRDQLARGGEGGEKTLGDAVVEAIREQLRDAGYEIQE